MDNTNNKNVFSLKLFWQTVIQLKVIGFISLAVVCIRISNYHRRT